MKKKFHFETKKSQFFLTDCEEYDEEDDDDGEVHVMNVDVHEGLHHMPDVITSECEQHGKSCLYFYNIVFVFLSGLHQFNQAFSLFKYTLHQLRCIWIQLNLLKASIKQVMAIKFTK